MLKNNDVSYSDLDTISAYSGKGWPLSKDFSTDLFFSWMIVQSFLDGVKK